MAQTEEFMFQNVAYRPTVYKTGSLPSNHLEGLSSNKTAHHFIMKPDFSKPVGDYLKVWWFESGTSISNLPWLDLENPNGKNDKDLKCIAVFKLNWIKLN